MQGKLTVSALAKRAGVTPKTLRFWEQEGLLPQATRTHTGYRLFEPEAIHYVSFILKSKRVGLTISEIKGVLELARRGRNPCPQVVKWIEEKARNVEEQINSLVALRRRLRQFRLMCSNTPVMACWQPKELCCLIEKLPNPKREKGGKNAKAMVRSVRNARRDNS